MPHIITKGARYEVSKFRDLKIRNDIENKWGKITNAHKAVLDFIREKTFIKCDKALPSYLVLIPLIYTCYHYQTSWLKSPGMETYLLRSLLSGAFGSHPDQLIDDCVKSIEREKGFDLNEIFTTIRSKGRSLEITDNRLFGMGYGSESIHLLFNLWYPGFNYIPAYENNLPQVDHVFPKSILEKIRTINPEAGRNNITKYKTEIRNQLANCMLLTREENGSGGKWDTLPKIWFANKPDEYLDTHLIPKDRSLWELDHFDSFIAERKKIDKNKIF